TAYTIVNGVITVPAGYLADRWNRTRTIGHTVVAWSGLTALTAAMPTYGSLLAIRSALGFGQAVTEPSAASLIGDYYPQEQRGKAFSVQQCLLLAGIGVGIGVGGIVGATLGWRAAFLIVGTPGVFIAIAMYRLREPARGEAERLHLGGDAGRPLRRPLHDARAGRAYGHPGLLPDGRQRVVRHLLPVDSVRARVRPRAGRDLRHEHGHPRAARGSDRRRARQPPGRRIRFLQPGVDRLRRHGAAAHLRHLPSDRRPPHRASCLQSADLRRRRRAAPGPRTPRRGRGTHLPGHRHRHAGTAGAGSGVLTQDRRAPTGARLARRRSVAAVISSTAASNVASLALEGLR